MRKKSFVGLGIEVIYILIEMISSASAVFGRMEWKYPEIFKKMPGCLISEYPDLVPTDQRKYFAGSRWRRYGAQLIAGGSTPFAFNTAKI